LLFFFPAGLHPPGFFLSNLPISSIGKAVIREWNDLGLVVSRTSEPYMNESFAKQSKYYFWIAGCVTALSALPLAIWPITAPQTLMGLTYYDQSPQLEPIVGHWGLMVALLGVLLFVSATAKHLRRSTILFAIIEKLYFVAAAIYCFSIGAPYAHCYLPALIVDSLLSLGGIWYIFRSWRLHEA
jgi:hypothetical protein